MEALFKDYFFRFMHGKVVNLKISMQKERKISLL
jgi:hypothetical protein